MKHVLVLDALNDSIGFLNAQRLKGASALQNMPYDTVALGRHQEALQSQDGIQFYHFTRQKNPALNMGHFKGGEHIEKYLEQLKEKLERINKAISNPERRETLDAIVIPGGILDNKSTERFIAKLRNTWPDVVVMVTDPILHAPGEKAPPAFRLVTQTGDIHPMYTDPYWHSQFKNLGKYEPVRQGTEGFELSPQVTLAIPNATRSMQADILRAELGMDPLGKLDPYEGLRKSAAERWGTKGGGHGGRG